MFKFNFSVENENENIADSDDKNPEPGLKSSQNDSPDAKPSRKLEVDSNQFKEIAENLKNSRANCFVSNDLEIGYLDNASFSNNAESDLIPRVYEGGFKIWECTQDLANFFTFYSSKELEAMFEGKKVCDLGCSAGILGIIALINGSNVDFQDYNEDVLENFTIPNVILSCEEREKPEEFAKCAFFSGDWDSFKDLTSSEPKYDTILTSETIYNPENYLKLINFFETRLKFDGKVYLSAKTYYFGVSGNVLDFCKILDAYGDFSHENIWKSSEGVQREILLIKFKRN